MKRLNLAFICIERNLSSHIKLCFMSWETSGCFSYRPIMQTFHWNVHFSFSYSQWHIAVEAYIIGNPVPVGNGKLKHKYSGTLIIGPLLGEEKRVQINEVVSFQGDLNIVIMFLCSLLRKLRIF